MKNSWMYSLVLVICVGAMIAASEPALAQAAGTGAFQPIETIAQQISSFLRGGFATSAALICLAAMGYRAWAGHIPWSWVLGFALGCAFIFGGPQIVQVFSSIGG